MTVEVHDHKRTHLGFKHCEPAMMTRRDSPGSIEFRSDAETRGCMGITALALGGLSVFAAGRLMGLWMIRDMPVALAVVGMLFMGSLAGVALYGTGPFVVSIDLVGRTYSVLQGFPWSPKTWTGTLDDFVCVCVEDRSTGSTRTAVAAIRRKAPGPTVLRVIGGMLSRQEAERQGRDLADQLGISFVDRC